MKNLKIFLCMLLIGITFSFPTFANNVKPVFCKDFQGILEAKKQIISLDNKFEWNNPNCKIVGTQSTFPKKAKFEKGLQLFVYQDYQLKFICSPGWVCKKYDSPYAVS
jgi:hypothetical protein